MIPKVAPSAPWTKNEQAMVIAIAMTSGQVLSRQTHHGKADGDPKHVGQHHETAVAHPVRHQPAHRPRHQVDEGKGRRDQPGGDRRQPPGFLKEHRQHRHHRQFGAEIGEIGGVERRDRAERIAVILGHALAQDRKVDPQHLPDLVDHERGDRGVADRGDEAVDIAHALHPVDQDRQDPDQRHGEDHQQRQIAIARHFQRAALAGFAVGVGGRAIGDGEPVEHAVKGP